MTPEQQREQWLKRILPALVLLVLYFILGSGFITSKTAKASKEVKDLKMKGIDSSQLPFKLQEQAKLNDELAKLEAEEKTIRDTLIAKSGFLAQKDTQNDSLDKLSVILAKHSISILEQKLVNNVDIDSLPQSFLDMQNHLSELSASPVVVAATAIPAAATTVTPVKPTINLWTIHFHGTYNDTFRALSELLASKIKILPVSLTMQAPKTSNPSSSTSSQLEWNLSLWL